jgi:hypothetical protein
MKITVKLTGALHTEMLRDLSRRHPFAAERVGFVAGRIGTGADGSRLLLLTRYYPIADAEYLKDKLVGARIGSEAITKAMHTVYHGRATHEGIFHIHLHGHQGEPGMSGVDSREIPPLIPGFQSIGRDAAHGVIILSFDHGSAWVWLPGNDEALQAASMAVIGVPIGVFQQRRNA